MWSRFGALGAGLRSTGVFTVKWDWEFEISTLSLTPNWDFVKICSFYLSAMPLFSLQIYTWPSWNVDTRKVPAFLEPKQARQLIKTQSLMIKPGDPKDPYVCVPLVFPNETQHNFCARACFYIDLPLHNTVWPTNSGHQGRCYITYKHPTHSQKIGLIRTPHPHTHTHSGCSVVRPNHPVYITHVTAR